MFVNAVILWQHTVSDIYLTVVKEDGKEEGIDERMDKWKGLKMRKGEKDFKVCNTNFSGHYDDKLINCNIPRHS